ncbi:MAG: hypothetical protein ACREIC_23285 [Limisphaerales bacterium]
MLFTLLLTYPVAAFGADYGARLFDGNGYSQIGPGPAYSGTYARYGANATGVEGRFSASYGEYGAVPGYGRFGSGSSFGSGPLRQAGTGKGHRAEHRSKGETPLWP